MKKKAVFFDRDGTLIVDKLYLNDPDQIVYLPDAFESLRRLRDGGYHFVVATNQSGVPRGLVDVSNLKKIHSLIRAEFSRHGVDFLSFHDAPYMTDTDHWYRKPNPGMILEGAKFYDIDLAASWMVGDRMTDVEAGHRAGTKSILLGSLESPDGSEFAPPEAHVQSLLEVADFILRHS
ncbi:MAG: HAD family hydrolase [Bdellovibrionaceae bacterium]|nr:HAD family hydrolase [Bdellovibrionales bacterium]MCB9084703.1 HAD family hydrolase [Pseudobdellovibrionaceae bacterium]